MYLQNTWKLSFLAPWSEHDSLLSDNPEHFHRAPDSKKSLHSSNLLTKLRHQFRFYLILQFVGLTRHSRNNFFWVTNSNRHGCSRWYATAIDRSVSSSRKCLELVVDIIESRHDRSIPFLFSIVIHRRTVVTIVTIVCRLISTDWYFPSCPRWIHRVDTRPNVSLRNCISHGIQQQRFIQRTSNKLNSLSLEVSNWLG